MRFWQILWILIMIIIPFFLGVMEFLDVTVYPPTPIFDKPPAFIENLTRKSNTSRDEDLSPTGAKMVSEFTEETRPMSSKVYTEWLTEITNDPRAYRQQFGRGGAGDPVRAYISGASEQKLYIFIKETKEDAAVLVRHHRKVLKPIQEEINSSLQKAKGGVAGLAQAINEH